MQSLKIPFLVILFFFACLFILPKLFGPIPFTVQNITSGKPDVFRVDGSGEASGVPNTAVITLGMTTENVSLLAAQQQNNSVMNTLKQDLKKLGVSEDDIKTINYSVYPNILTETEPLPQPVMSRIAPADVMQSAQDAIEPMQVKELPSSLPQFSIPVPPGVTPKSYTVNQSIQVQVKKIDTINQIIDAATKAGANEVGNISFTFDDATKKKLEEKARENAIKEAKEKAESLAKAAGLSLGKIVDIQSYPTYGVANGYARSAVMVKDGGTDVNPGEGTIQVNVNLAYELR